MAPLTGSHMSNEYVKKKEKKHGPSPRGYCFFCDNLWWNHRGSMMALLCAQGLGTGDNELDSALVACNIFSSYFAFQAHAERYHGWRLGEIIMRSLCIVC